MRQALRILAIVTLCFSTLRADEDSNARIQDPTQSQTSATSQAPVQSQKPIVLEPSRDANPPVVQLNSREDGASDDPLRIGEFELIDRNGDPFSSKELEGHPWVASFIFTRCAGYCPNLIGKLRLEVVDRVKDPDVRFVTITVDPEHDTPEKLKQYAEVFGADPERWKFLTGDKETIYQLVLHGFRLPVAELQGEDRRPGYEVAHSLSLIHVGPDGRIIGKYDSRNDQEILSLRRVLNGQIETPEENRAEVLLQQAEERAQPRDIPKVPPEEPGFVRNEAGELPEWAARLPQTNAMLNGLATILLLMGFTAIKTGHVAVHKRLMLMAFGTSMIFLVSYLAYHAALDYYTGLPGRKFTGTGTIQTIYYGILISHVLLAMAVPVLAIITIRRALLGRWAAHRRIARVTFPIWLYVSVTGVIIYGMLYHWPV